MNSVATWLSRLRATALAGRATVTEWASLLTSEACALWQSLRCVRIVCSCAFWVFVSALAVL